MIAHRITILVKMDNFVKALTDSEAARERAIDALRQVAEKKNDLALKSATDALNAVLDKVDEEIDDGDKENVPPNNK